MSKYVQNLSAIIFENKTSIFVKQTNHSWRKLTTMIGKNPVEDFKSIGFANTGLPIIKKTGESKSSYL